MEFLPSDGLKKEQIEEGAKRYGATPTGHVNSFAEMKNHGGTEAPMREAENATCPECGHDSKSTTSVTLGKVCSETGCRCKNPAHMDSEKQNASGQPGAICPSCGSRNTAFKDNSHSEMYCGECYHVGPPRDFSDPKGLNENASGRAKIYTFQDQTGEKVEIQAPDQSAAWDQLRRDFGTSIADMQAMGIKLVSVRENAEDGSLKTEEVNAMKLGTCASCGESGQVDEDTGFCKKCTDDALEYAKKKGLKNADHECYFTEARTGYPLEHCPKCGATKEDLKRWGEKIENAEEPPCPQCKKPMLKTKDGFACRDCGDEYTQAELDAEHPGKMEHANAEETCPSCGLPKKMYKADDTEHTHPLCGNRQCKQFKNTPDGTLTDPENLEKQNDVKPERSIMRDGIAAGNDKYGTKQNASNFCPLCDHELNEHDTNGKCTKCDCLGKKDEEGRRG